MTTWDRWDTFPCSLRADIRVGIKSGTCPACPIRSFTTFGDPGKWREWRVFVFVLRAHTYLVNQKARHLRHSPSSEPISEESAHDQKVHP
jgi:hypothetical protein